MCSSVSKSVFGKRKRENMDHADALRIVVFEYLLPMQRRNRVRCLESCFSREQIDIHWSTESTVSGCLERMLILSDRLLTIRFRYVVRTSPKHGSMDTLRMNPDNLSGR